MNVVEEPKGCPINITSSCPLLYQPGKKLMSYLRHIKRARKSNFLKRSGTSSVNKNFVMDFDGYENA